MEKRKCVICGKEFTPKRKMQKTCCGLCSASYAMQIPARRYRLAHPLTERTCIYCGKIFMPKNGNQKTCSKRCREKNSAFASKLWGAKFRSRKKKEERSVLLETRSVKPADGIYTNVCPTCGQWFKTRDGDAKYCSDECEIRAKMAACF